jgi:hypothetical protein
MAEIKIRFENPPPRGSGREWSPKGTHEGIASRLKKKPLKWAHIQTLSTVQSAANQADAVRGARLVAYGPAGSFEAVSRTVDGEHRVYARFVGAVGV